MDISIKRQINESILLMNETNYDQNHDIYRNIDRIQAFGGDNLNAVCDKLSIKGNKAYTICGSGDHPLELVNYGFTYIEAFDINLLAEHMLNLKIAAILSLEYDEFIFFSKRLFLAPDLLEKIFPILPSKSQEYFHGLLNLKNGENIYNRLFTHKYMGYSEFMEAVKNNFSFYNEKDFYILKAKLLKSTIVFRHQNLFETPKLEEKYDFMYFSNILLFRSMSIDDFKKHILPQYIDNLKKDGIIVMHYLHHFIGNDRSNFYQDLCTQKNNEKSLEELADFVTTTLEIESSGFGRGTKEKDMALVFKK